MHVDVFTALCVLVSLDALDKERRILVAGENERDDEEMIRRGTELLIEMSMYNSVATRYTQSLEQLRKETRASASGGRNGGSTGAEPAVGSVQAAFQSAPNPLFFQDCSTSYQGKTSRMSARSDGSTSGAMTGSGVDYRSPWQGKAESGSRTAMATDMFNPGDSYSVQDTFSPSDWLSASWLGGNISLDQSPQYQVGTMPMNGLFPDEPMLSDFNLANLNLVL